MIMAVEVLRCAELENWLGIINSAQTTNKHVLIEEGGKHYLVYYAKPFVPRIASVIIPIIGALIFFFGLKWYVFTPAVVLLPYLTLSPYFWFWVSKYGARKHEYKGLYEMLDEEETEDLLWKAAFGEEVGAE